MDKQALISELKLITREIFSGRGLELFDLVCHYQGRDLLIQILVDFPEGGISVGECARLNKEIIGILEKKELIPEGYILEVASPGLDRPLKENKDFLRCLNRKIRFFFKEPVKGKFELEGVISRVTDDAVSAEVFGETVEIPLGVINQAKQVV